MGERDPVFVAGLERSGTSLLYALLASHPHLAMTRRTNLWRYFYGRFGDLGIPRNRERCIETMRRYKRLRVLELDFDRLRDDFEAGEHTYGRLFALIGRQHSARLGKGRWGDKSLNTERHAAAVFEAFPDARILHMVRDPRDRFASSRTRWKRRRGGVGAGTAEWLASVALAEENSRRHPENYMVVRYEDLVTDPPAMLSRICGFIGEEYTDGLLSMEGAKSFREQGSNSSYGDRPPGLISTDSIGRFRQVLGDREIAFVQSVAGERMTALGYDLVSLELSRADTLRLLLLDGPLEWVRLLGWRALDAYRRNKGEDVPGYRLVQEAV